MTKFGKENAMDIGCWGFLFLKMYFYFNINVHMAYKGLEFGTLKKVIFIILSLIFEPVN